MMMKRLAAVAFAMFSLWPTLALAQSSPGLVFGQVPTAAQWNGYFQQKQDVLAYTPVNRAGDTMTGQLTLPPSGTAGAGFNLPMGVAPTAPNDGDVWTTTSGLFARINGSTQGPFFSSGSLALTTGSIFYGVGGVATATTPTAFLDSAMCSTQGAVITRQGAAWVCLPPGPAGAPLISAGAAANLAYGTVSGNTTKFATVFGTPAAGDCASWDASGNVGSAGGPCTTGGGGGTVTSATAGQLAYYAATGTVIVGTPLITISGSNVVLPSGPLYVGTTSSTTTAPKFVSRNAAQTVAGLEISGSDSHWLLLNPSMPVGSLNSLTQAGDTAINFSNGTIGTGALVIAPWLAGIGGLRMDATGAIALNSNVTALPSTGPIAPLLRLAAADGANTTIYLDAFSTSGASPIIQGRRTGGTNASKAPTSVGTALLNLLGTGYGATGYSTNLNAAAISLQANETWSDTAQGTAIRFTTTPNGSVVPVVGFAFQNGSLFLGNTGAIGGSLIMYGLTSGQATIQAQAAAGAPSLLWPTTSGTLVSSATGALAINATTGVISAAIASTTNFWAGTANTLADSALLAAAFAEQTLTDNIGGSITVDFAHGRNWVLQLTGSSNTRALANPVNMTSGGGGCVRFIQSASGGNQVTLGSGWFVNGGHAGFSLSLGANQQDMYCFNFLFGNIGFGALAKAIAN